MPSDDDFEVFGDPPSQAEVDLGYDVRFIVSMFEQAARNQYLPWALSTAMSALDRHASSSRSTIRLGTRDRDQLLRAAAAAHASAFLHLPRPYNRRQIDLGMAAVAGQIVRWSETDEERTARHPHVYADMRDFARMFRNDLHNASLMENVTDRKAERRVDCVHAIYGNACHNLFLMEAIASRKAGRTA